MPGLEERELGITHVPREQGFDSEAASILAALLECRDLMFRVRYATVGYDQCDTWTDEIVKAGEAIDSAIAGFVEDTFYQWAWSKELDAESIRIETEDDESL